MNKLTHQQLAEMRHEMNKLIIHLNLISRQLEQIQKVLAENGVKNES